MWSLKAFNSYLEWPRIGFNSFLSELRRIGISISLDLILGVKALNLIVLPLYRVYIWIMVFDPTMTYLQGVQTKTRQTDARTFREYELILNDYLD